MNLKIYLILLLANATLITFGAPFKNLKTNLELPNGEIITLYTSGDEFINWLHTEDGFTVIQDIDGYYYFAEKKNNTVVPSKYRVDKKNKARTILDKNIKPSKEAYDQAKSFFGTTVLTKSLSINSPLKSPHKGVLNNIIVYIRFYDDESFDLSRENYNTKFNAENAISLKNYYNEVSYGRLSIESSHFPENTDSVNNSYKDPNSRGFYQPYNETTNTLGYKTSTESRDREHYLLDRAIRSVKNEIESIFTPEQLDGDNDGQVDQMCFIIRGNNSSWSNLLWAHRWTLSTTDTYIHNKVVRDYIFMPESQVDVMTICHETFHGLGAPDLYHYNDDVSDLNSTGKWGLMSTQTSHMGAYMKWKYSSHEWIDSIPEIKAFGTYSLFPLSERRDSICYKIKSPVDSNEYFVFEYRKQSGIYESQIPGSGLLIYRINPSLYGNAQGPPDEVYIYRPNGTNTNNGSLNLAHFDKAYNRGIFNSMSNPSPFHTSGKDAGIQISNIHQEGEKLAFTFSDEKLSQEIQFDTIRSRNYDSGTFLISPIATSGLAVDTRSLNDSIVSIINNQVYINGTGSTSIVANQRGNDYYTPAVETSRNITITKGHQLISWNIKEKDEYIVLDTIVLDVSCSSNLPLSYISTDTTVARLSGKNIIILKEGNTSIIANQNGNQLWQAATPVSQELKINISDDGRYKIYSNPFDKELTIVSAVKSNLKIYDLNGNQHINTTIDSGEQQIQTSHLPTGVYILQIYNKGHTYTENILKK